MVEPPNWKNMLVKLDHSSNFGLKHETSSETTTSYTCVHPIMKGTVASNKQSPLKTDVFQKTSRIERLGSSRFSWETVALNNCWSWRTWNIRYLVPNLIELWVRFLHCHHIARQRETENTNARAGLDLDETDQKYCIFLWSIQPFEEKKTKLLNHPQVFFPHRKHRIIPRFLNPSKFTYVHWRSTKWTELLQL